MNLLCLGKEIGVIFADNRKLWKGLSRGVICLHLDGTFCLHLESGF